MLRLGLSRSILRTPALKTWRQASGPSVLAFRSYPVSMASIRFNSSTSTPTTPPTPPAGVAHEISDKLTAFDDSTTSETVQHITDLHSDQIGYLQSIGLGQGWGPTALIERFLEFTHVYTGLPWWATIIVAAISLRVVMFPLYIKASENATRMTKIKPELEALMNEVKTGDQMVQMRAMTKRSQLMKKHDVSTFASLLPMVQVPVAYGFFQALRKMANANVEGFSDQGIAWVQNLVEADPYLGLHAISAAAFISIVRLGGETGQHPMAKGMKTVMTILPIASIFITKNFAAAIMVYFAVNSLFSLVQSALFKSNWFRKVAGMSPKLSAAEMQAKNPGADRSVKDMISKFMDDSKEKSMNKVKETNKKLELTKKRKESVSLGFIKRH